MQGFLNFQIRGQDAAVLNFSDMGPDAALRVQQGDIAQTVKQPKSQNYPNLT